MNEAGDPQAEPDRTPWYRSVPFRMALLVLFAVAFSWVLGAVARFIAPY